ncbi:MAG: recombinase family protein [Motilibacteraceae bacterium]
MNTNSNSYLANLRAQQPSRPTSGATTKTTHGKDAALELLRKSSKPGEDNCSFEVQAAGTAKIFEREGYHYDPRPIEEGGSRLRQVVSGWKKSANRQKIKELISVATSGRYKAVVVYKLDRIGRRVSEVSEYFEQLAEHNVLLISACEGTFDLSDPMQMQFALFLAVQAQGESANTSVRVSRDRAARKQKGAWLGGPPPFGWEVDFTLVNGERVYNKTKEDTKRLRLHPAEKDILLMVIDWVMTDRMSVISAVRKANEQGFRNRRGEEFRYNHMRALLRNPVLFGGVPQIDYDSATGHAIERSMRPALDADGNPHIINEPLISYEQFVHLQTLIAQQATWVANRSGQAPLLSSLIVCGSGPLAADGSRMSTSCGQRMYGSGEPHATSSYACRVSSQNRQRCAGNTITQVAVENWVIAVFLQLLAQPDFAARHAELVTQALSKQETRAADHLAELRRHQAELKDLEERGKSSSGRALHLVLDAIETTEARITELQELLAQDSIAPESLQPFVNMDPEHVWATASHGQRAAWLATVFSRVEILPAATGPGAQKGGFGSRGLDPRRIRIYTHHDPSNPIVAPDDYQPAVPDLGGAIDCPDCGKEQKNWAGLAAHRRWSHGVVSKSKAARGESATEFRCYEKGCDAVFYVEVPLRNHLWYEHGITKNYPCPQCQRVFALPAHLGRHMVAHREEKDACELCGKVVKLGGLRLHKVRAHGPTPGKR